MKFIDPDGTLVCYGVRIYTNGEPHNYALTVQGTGGLMNVPVLPAPFDDECTCPTWGNPSWPHRHGCPAHRPVVNE